LKDCLVLHIPNNPLRYTIRLLSLFLLMNGFVRRTL